MSDQGQDISARVGRLEGDMKVVSSSLADMKHHQNLFAGIVSAFLALATAAVVYEGGKIASSNDSLNDKVQKSIDTVDRRVDEINNRIDLVSGRIDQINSHVEQIAIAFAQLSRSPALITPLLPTSPSTPGPLAPSPAPSTPSLPGHSSNSPSLRQPSSAVQLNGGAPGGSLLLSRADVSQLSERAFRDLLGNNSIRILLAVSRPSFKTGNDTQSVVVNLDKAVHDLGLSSNNAVAQEAIARLERDGLIKKNRTSSGGFQTEVTPEGLQVAQTLRQLGADQSDTNVSR